MRDHDGRLTFAPRLPEAITRLRFRVLYRDRCLVVTVKPGEASYRLRDGDPLDIWHHGRQVTVDDEELVLAIPPAPKVDPVQQPAGRAPQRRGRGAAD
jgi:alpha,alpha-trehalose phosphorylase